eukprot:scaffold457100_cov41-Prasinocladus_malaysianus.AAC.1
MTGRRLAGDEESSGTDPPSSAADAATVELRPRRPDMPGAKDRIGLAAMPTADLTGPMRAAVFRYALPGTRPATTRAGVPPRPEFCRDLDDGAAEQVALAMAV